MIQRYEWRVTPRGEVPADAIVEEYRNAVSSLYLVPLAMPEFAPERYEGRRPHLLAACLRSFQPARKK